MGHFYFPRNTFYFLVRLFDALHISPFRTISANSTLGFVPLQLAPKFYWGRFHCFTLSLYSSTSLSLLSLSSLFYLSLFIYLCLDLSPLSLSFPLPTYYLSSFHLYCFLCHRCRKIFSASLCFFTNSSPNLSPVLRMLNGTY